MASTTIPSRVLEWVERNKTGAPVASQALSEALSLPEPLCTLLVLRGYGDVESARAFLRPRLELLHDPYAMTGMAEAVDRITAAIRSGEGILVHGDYDVDGVCATALLTRVLRTLGARVEPFVPRRIADGYDLGPAGVEAAREAGATLIITADCGIVANEAVELAARAGVDVVVTDHHTPGAELPDAVAVLNPNRPDCTYPEKILAGTGVAFKLCQALAREHGLEPESVHYHLDLVALATVADVVPLKGENRILTRFGLRVLAQTRNPGLEALVRRTGLADGRRLLAGHVSHVLGPRINAVGRVDEASWGVRLLLAESEGEADRLAERLESRNRERQALDRRILQEAVRLLERSYRAERDYGVVLAGEDWHPGVIGIVASRVVELIHRPTVLLALRPGAATARGSARSIPGFDLYTAIERCASHLIRFGGHRHAAGLEIETSRIDAFRDAFRSHAAETLTPDQLVATIRYDLDLPLGEANAELHRYLRYLGPFGAGNPEPVFVSRSVAVAGYPRVVGEGHVKLTLAQNGARLRAIGFRMADRMRELDVSRGTVDVAYQLQENRWNGRTELQARLVDLRPSA